MGRHELLVTMNENPEMAREFNVTSFIEFPVLEPV